MTEASLRASYGRQRIRAHQRAIAWEFTFESWLAVWQASGRLNERGRGPGQFVMSRPGDVGPYSPQNVRIVTARANCLESLAVAPRTRLGAGRGWSPHKGKCQVRVRGMYIGIFETPEAAVVARAAALAQTAAA